MISAKNGAVSLVSVLKARNIKHIVLCPGSRNAPLVDAFSTDPFFSCYSIVDERSAGFFALGIAQTIRDTVAVSCTSGSALLNLAPAVAEAYYQRIGLLIISADRPEEWLDQGESQTLSQANVFNNFIKTSYNLVQEPNDDEALWFHERQINEAINHTRNHGAGPVQLNIRFREPLYDRITGKAGQPKVITEAATTFKLTPETIESLHKEWNQAKRVLVICGMMQPDPELRDLIDRLKKLGAVIFVESTSNLQNDGLFNCIDKLVIPRSEAEKKKLKPDLLITLGGPLVSRKIKSYLRSHRPKKHWHIDPVHPMMDAYQALTTAVKAEVNGVLSEVVTFEQRPGDYQDAWMDYSNSAEEIHAAFLSKAPFSDLKAFSILMHELPEGAHLQIGNSSAIRYVQLMKENNRFISYSNRGTSGIEGSLSTAVGASVVSEKDIYHITGDLSLMYDSNGLWNHYLNKRLKIILINNGGGGIFRIIEGPSKMEHFEKFVETTHKTNFSKLAALFKLNFQQASDEISLSKALKELVSSKGPALMEIKTDRELNDKVLMNYFDSLKTEK